MAPLSSVASRHALTVPCCRPPPQRESPGSGEGKAPLRFRVSLGSGQKADDPAAAEAAAKLAAEQAQREERLLHKYGLAAEASRRLVPADRDFGPSGVLLRDCCCALLRLAAGRAAKGEQPRAGKLQSEENEVRAGGLWEPCEPCARKPCGWHTLPAHLFCDTSQASRSCSSASLPSPPAPSLPKCPSPPCPLTPAAEPAALARARVQRGVGLC